MLTFLIILFFSSAVSFVGSLQLGPVNLYVINTALFNSKKEALWVAFGGALPEIAYCALAICMNSYFQSSLIFQVIFQVLFVIILFCLSIVFWLKKNQSYTSENHKSKPPLLSFLKGFSLASLNPQLLPFWMFVEVYFNSMPFLHICSGYEKTAFMLGAGLGALILLLILVLLVHKYKLLILRYINNKFYFKLLSIIFLLLAIQQVVKLTYIPDK
jgi:threonine/homoserine/homoserine lactone efflux protein